MAALVAGGAEYLSETFYAGFSFYLSHICTSKVIVIMSVCTAGQPCLTYCTVTLLISFLLNLHRVHRVITTYNKTLVLVALVKILIAHTASLCDSV